MKASKFSEAQIAFVLKQAEDGHVSVHFVYVSPPPKAAKSLSLALN